MDKIDTTSNDSLPVRIGNRYLTKNLSHIKPIEISGHILTKEEKEKLKRLKRKTYFLSALTGAVFVLLVILPFHFSDFFKAQQISIMGYRLDFEIYNSVYAIIMVFPEIWILNVLNMRAVKQICEIYQYPPPEHDDYKEQIQLLTEAGLEISDKHMLTLGINPYVGLPKISYWSLFLFTKLESLLSNLLVKLIVRRILGRYALRIFMDLVGVPVYAFWDAWASHKVMKEVKIRLVSTAASKQFLRGFSTTELESVRSKIPSLVNYIAQEKRAYNFALYAFMKEVSIKLPGITLKMNEKVHLDRIFGNNDAENYVLARLLIFGFIVDGTLSVKERLLLYKLGKEEWFPLQLHDVERIMKEYVYGEGLENF